MERKMPSGHAHGMPAGMSGMMGTEPASDEELKPKKHDNTDGHHD